MPDQNRWADQFGRLLGRIKRGRWFLAILLAVFAVWMALQWGTSRRVDLATFNIENFPKSQAQIEGVFRVIDDLQLEMVGVQEITQPERFRREAKRRLGPSWAFVHADHKYDHHVGLLYDRAVFRKLGHQQHRETVVSPGAKPTLEVRLQRRGFGEALRVFVVHLKAYPEGLDQRRRQYAALHEIVGSATPAKDRYVLLGDFNATEPEDGHLLNQLAGATSMAWRTAKVGCTSYWKPADRCLSSSLDHILVEGVSSRGRARGPCQTVGCDPGQSCPVFFRQVSDHCPVVLSIP